MHCSGQVMARNPFHAKAHAAMKAGAKRTHPNIFKRVGRVEGWRAGVARGPDPHHVSSPLHVARNVRISRIARPHLLHAKAYGTYPAGATFGPSRRTR